MKITWLGQAGLLFECGGKIIMIDPYLSDSVGKIDPAKHRRVPVKEELFDIKPDIMLFTHNHLDHYDPETVERFITKDTGITVLAPKSAWDKVRTIGGANNYISFNHNTVWTEGGIRFTAVKAEHSDDYAIGVIIEYKGKKYYVTGDTLYNKAIFKDIPSDIYALFLPVNGVGNNMNMTDAAEFCKMIKPQIAVPLHFGLFDELDVSGFDYDNKIIPNIYEVIFNEDN
ncbi:MAG: MBL fold metallo-hydrolase [Clostridia bacterium]|nr:MBL fold metallo-hydrolase [Clostridia bacterium]